jgi:hypothetical protein
MKLVGCGIVDNWKNSQNSVRKKSFSNCQIIGLDTGSLVLIVFGPNHLDLVAAIASYCNRTYQKINNG